MSEKNDTTEQEEALLKDNKSDQEQLQVRDDDDDADEDLEYHADTVITILKPVAITMIFVVWAVRTITIPGKSAISYIMPIAQEQSTDSAETKFWKALVTALVVLVAILLTTVLFVILYKYRCLKIIFGWLILSSLILLAAFGGTFAYLLLQAYNLPFDILTFTILLWNFSIVGILSIFWHGATRVNQGYLILISGLLAIMFTRLPEWTTFAILAIVAIYDIVAVLSPCGPLKVLVETAQQRQEPIPALLYNASVWVMMADKQPPEPSVASQTQSSSSSSQESAPSSKRKGVKLGLGDFIFYSVLIGRAALFDMITVFTCFIAIITGLFLTLLLLAIFRKALPALPISIALGLLFYFLTRFTLLPFVLTLGSVQIVV